MATVQPAELAKILMGKLVLVLVVGAILVVLVGLPLSWLRLKLERGLIRALRSARSKRQKGESTASANESATTPHCPVCNSLMVKRVTRRGSGAGSTFWGCSNYPRCRGTRAILAIN